MAHPITWIIQTNLLAHGQVKAVWEAALRAGAAVHEAVVIPFSDELGNEIPDFEGVVIPYGSTKLTRMAQQRNWEGLCFDPHAFRVDAWNQHRSDMLNHDVRHMTVRQAMEIMASEPADSQWFIRPVEDLKHFNGTVSTAREICRWMSSVDSGNFSFADTTEVIVAPLRDIHAEWRYFVVGGQVADGSLYRHAGRPRLRHIDDPQILEQAQALANGWLPHATCVMDVALTDEGFKVIEFNAFNSSGFYAHDISKIVQAATDYFRPGPDAVSRPTTRALSC